MAHLGLIGIGVMGSALALNLAQNGHTVSLLDRSMDKMQSAVKTAKIENLSGKLIACQDAQSFVSSIPAPRTILVLVPSGGPLDSVVSMLTSLLDKGDLIADLGNSNYTDTEKRVKELEAQGFQFLGIGISGGAEGARTGPSIMAGGSQESWTKIKAPLQDTAAKFKGEPCVDWFGPGGAGHFVKMIHNGIEYADMQLIGESYGLMANGLGMKANKIGKVFQKWNQGPLNSYLVEIAAEVSLATDTKTNKPMLDIILDKAGQKGTGRWSVIEALHLGSPAGMMSAAVEARNISADIDIRREMQAAFGASPQLIPQEMVKKKKALKAMEGAMIAGKILAYAQGLEVLSKASDEFGWNLDLAAIARVWRAGCIIRSSFLDEISAAFENGKHKHLVLAPVFKDYLNTHTPALQSVTAFGLINGHAVPAFSAALNYHNMRRTARSTANMIQGLRDYFGAHTFERLDGLGEKVNGPWHDK